MEELQQQLVDASLKHKLPPLLHRELIKLQDVDEQETIRIMQWNILAQALCNGADNFILCPTEALQWQLRQHRILEEMTRFDPTVFCLQEVDKFEFLKEKLAPLNYKGLFFPKPDSPCLFSPEHSGPDGCAVFYKADKLDLLTEEKVILKDDDGNFTNQVCIICKYKEKGSYGKEFYVANTHLKAKSGYEELRLQQGKNLLKTLHGIVGSQPVIVCGDFNGSPKEPVYSEFKNSKLNLSSAYSHLSTDGSEVMYTTWKIRGDRNKGQVESCKTIDYMWYSTGKVKVNTVLSIPSDESIGKNRLPSMSYPSDHFSLLCDVALL